MPQGPTKRSGVGADKALEESEARFAALADASTDGIAIHEAGRFLVAGRALEAMCGYGPGELVGRRVVDLVAPEARADALAAMAERTETPKEYAGLRKDGSTFPLRVVARNVTRQGVSIRVAVVRDLSAEQAALAAAAASERRWRLLAALVPVAVFETDAQGDCLFVNERWQQTAGMTANEAKGRGWVNAIHPDDRDRVRDEWYAAAAAGREFRLEYRFVTPAGRVTWVQGGAMAQTTDDVVTGYLGTATDITERRELEAQASLRDRLTAVGRLAAGVAHEINSPLQYITTNLELALEALPARGDTAAIALTDSLVQAREGAERIRKIVLGLSTISRPSEDRPVVLDVRPLLERAIVTVFGSQPGPVRVALRLGDTPLVSAGEVALAQAFTAVLTNAADALASRGPSGKQVRVVSRTDADGRAIVEVHDSGAGIAPEHLERVFDPFFTTKRPGEAVGLGLWICHGVVTSMGGSVSVRSTPGDGTTFTLTLPAAIARAVSIPPKPTPVDTRGKVLVIDDDLLVATAIRRVLAKAHDVTCTADAREALALLRAGGAFDVILTDLMMPSMTGMEFFEVLEKELPAERGKVLFMSGGTFLDDVPAFLDRVANPCLTKPIPAATLRAAIASAVCRARGL